VTVPFLLVAPLGLSLAGAYIFIIRRYIQGWRALPAWELPQNFSPQTKVSVIVPARNEEENMLACLESLAAQNYPAELFEIIVVDDHSTDGTARLVSVFSEKNKNVKLLCLADFVEENETQSFKKKAIETAITQAEGELIATIDADCEVPVDWLRLMVSFFQGSGKKFIAAPVNFHHEESLLERFQSLDFIGMMGVTGAGIHLGWMNMCNGANLAYSKSAFQEVGGFSGIDHLASGDDILLMQKMAEHFPGRVGFLKNPKATVLTRAKPSVKSFFSQRLRWATKSTSYREWAVTLTLAVVLFFCLGILGSATVGLFFGWEWLALSLILFLVKSGADYFFLREMSRYFGRADLLRSFFAAQILHILYIVSVGLVSNCKKQYEWKGRRVR
jgi:cellulose synthase/poly-beta-1,6-N-acetylglucosamine synthase-like glycosyltransferase